jgi:nicotinamide mononucleotide (NMN) deamidase PncC
MKTEIVKYLHDCGKMFFIAATGGGTSFIGEFLKTSGGSKCIAGGYIPYAIEATNQFVGGKLDKYADGNAARKLAVASFEQCVKLNIKSDINCVGVGIACSLVKDNERSGREHQISIAIHTYDKTTGITVVLKHSRLNRIEEENFVNDLTLFLLYKEFSGKLPDREWENQHRMIFLENDAEITKFEGTSPFKEKSNLYVHSV